MSAFGDVRAELVGKLVAAGVPASGDPARQAPCVLVDACLVTGTAGIGAWTVTTPVVILATPPLDAKGLAWMEEQLEAVLLALGPGRALYRTYNLAGKDLPAYVVEIAGEAANPTC